MYKQVGHRTQYVPWGDGAGGAQDFSPKAFLVDMLEKAILGNRVICTNSENEKSFLITKVTTELFLRGRLDGKIAIIVSTAMDELDAYRQTFTVSTSIKEVEIVLGKCSRNSIMLKFFFSDTHEFSMIDFSKAQVILTLPKTVKKLFEFIRRSNLSPDEKNLTLPQCGLLIIDNFESRAHHGLLEQVDSFCDTLNIDKPHTLGLTSHILKNTRSADQLKQQIYELETTSGCKVETSGEFSVSGVFDEKVIVCDYFETDLKIELESAIQGPLMFLLSCNFKDDPMGIPLVFLAEAKLLLEQLGPWALYRFYQTNIRYLQRRAKLETRYNHIIGLELLMTSMRKIYVICDEKMRTTGFSREFVTTKVARLMDVLREYKPEVKQKNPDSQFNDRDNANYVSWHNDQNLDVDDAGSDEAPGPTPFTNRLWGCVLVNERPVAKYLGKILKDAARADPDLAHISSQALCQLAKVDNPNGHLDEEEIADEKKKQEEALHKFRTREANILIAQAETENEAHRHFDIPKCNLVVRFDAPGSYLRYDGGKRLLSQQNDALYGILINKKEKIQFCRMLEEFKMLEEYLKNRASLAEEAGPAELCLDLDVTHLFEDMPKMRPQIKLSMQNSLSLLNKYCNRLPCDSFTQLSVLRKTLQLANGKFQTSLVLPNNSHLRGIVVGHPKETAELSKRSAALEACTKLRILGELDDFLFNSSKEMDKYKFEIDPFPNPLSRKRKPPPGMEGGPKRRQKYPRHIPRSLRAKPKDSKAEGASALPVPEKECYVYRISMFYRHGVNLEPIHQQVCFSATQLEIIKSFHQYIIQDVIRIERPGGVVQFNPDKSPVPYLIAPVDCDNGIEWEIDWDYLTESIAGRVLAKEAAEAERRVNTYSEDDPFIFHKSEYEDSVVICSYRRHDAPTQNRFYVAEIQYDMDPDSPFPADDYESFRQYYMQRWALCLTNEKQPLLDVDHTDCRLNLLTPRFVTQKGRALPASALEKKRQKYEDKANRQYLIPEILDVHPVSASLWRKAVCLPSILHRITCLLAAEDLRRRISRQTRVDQILQTLTLSKSSDGFNLERLEMLGDCFLKYSVTVYLYCKYEHQHEGQLSFFRSKKVSNRNLFRLGVYNDIPGRMVAEQFMQNDTGGNWLPPGYFNKDHAALEKPLIYNHYSDQYLTDKSIADCMEALIGAYLKATGIEATQQFLCYMGLIVLPSSSCEPETGKPLPPFLLLAPPIEPFHLKSCTQLEKMQRLQALDKLTRTYGEFEKKIGYTFKNKGYLLQSLTHASYQYNQVTNCYQRLEFLGDAVLDFLITRHLFDHPTKRFSPGELTDLRAALVNNNIFAALAVKFDFHKYLYALTPDLHNVIRDYVLYCQTRQDVEGMEAVLKRIRLEEEPEEEEGDHEDSEDIEVPKVLGDIYESVAGAIYLDSGMNLDAVWGVYRPMLQKYIDKYSINPPRSPIRELLELEPETAKFSAPEKRADGKYRVTVHIANNKGRFAGAGRNHKAAKASAARAALNWLKKTTAEIEDGIED
ncbi:unnamed protein product [Oikopleura dioica]|uniref:Uncharacterized protein n=1 Tax=Oikopleura dioica TaxID=34765 RepID=E4XP58_OIKDI|nr:unnamed protein product [Oikopleura dioica]